MQRLKTRFISAFIISLLISSCSVPKVAKTGMARKLPETLDLSQNELSVKTDTFKGVTIESYFKDPQLIALLQKALSSNPDYLVMQQRMSIANTHLKAAKLLQLPSLNLRADASGTRFADYTMEGVGNYDTNLSPNISEDQKINRDFTPNYFLGAQVSWEADIWGRLSGKKKAALNQYLASKEAVRLLQSTMLTDIADLYYLLVALDKQADVVRKNLKAQQNALEIVTVQRSVGKATELAVQQFRAQNNRVLAQAREVDLKRDQTEKALLTLLGEYGGRIDRSSGFVLGHLEVLNQKISVDTVVHQRPDVQKAFLELRASHADALSARAAFFPKLEISAFGGLNSFSAATFFNVGSLAGQILGSLTAPVFQRGRIRQEFNVATASQEIAFIQYQNSVTTAFNEISALVNRARIFQEVLDYRNREIENLEIAVDVANDLYLSGYANYLEIISAQRTKLEAELGLIDTQLENARSQVQLYKALGGTISE